VPSLVTSIIGGVQGASAAHHAADAQKQGYTQAGQTVDTAVQNANPILSTAADAAGGKVQDAAAAAGTGVTNAAGGANALLQPYIDNGTAASNKYTNLTQAGFNFNPSDLQNTPGYQFALQQGLKGTNAAASAAGTLGSGGNLKAAANYATGLASTTYQQQYQDALQGYQANVNSLLPGMQQGLTASGQAGSNLLGAAQYSGSTNLAGAQYAGNAGMWAGGQQASNLVNAGVYKGNTQIGSGNAQAQGDIGAANSWNSMLGGIGSAGNQVLAAGFGGGGSGGGSGSGGGWSFGNIGAGLANMYGAGSYGGSTNGGGSGAVTGTGQYMPPINVFG
jgi:hypothetical protein